MIAYPDTGFLVSLYGQDGNSAAASALTRSRPIFLLTPLVELEFGNAVELRVFRREWTRREAGAVREAFARHQASGVFRAETLGAEAWESALVLSRRHSARVGSRTLDLLHVAAALVLRPDALFTFDERQRRVARAEGLRLLPA